MDEKQLQALVNELAKNLKLKMYQSALAQPGHSR